jgi:hypothetical protein
MVEGMRTYNKRTNTQTVRQRYPHAELQYHCKGSDGYWYTVYDIEHDEHWAEDSGCFFNGHFIVVRNYYLKHQGITYELDDNPIPFCLCRTKWGEPVFLYKRTCIHRVDTDDYVKDRDIHDIEDISTREYDPKEEEYASMDIREQDEENETLKKVENRERTKNWYNGLDESGKDKIRMQARERYRINSGYYDKPSDRRAKEKRGRKRKPATPRLSSEECDMLRQQLDDALDIIYNYEELLKEKGIDI